MFIKILNMDGLLTMEGFGYSSVARYPYTAQFDYKTRDEPENPADS